MTRSEQTTTFTPEYRRSSSVHFLADAKDSALVMRKLAFGTIGLLAGSFQVIVMKGTAASAAAATDNTRTHFAALVFHRMTQLTTEDVMTASSIVKANFPLKRRTIAVAVAPVP